MQVWWSGYAHKPFVLPEVKCTLAVAWVHLVHAQAASAQGSKGEQQGAAGLQGLVQSEGREEGG